MINKATFALGCFWQPDEFFSNLPGVKSVRVGYTGGDTEQPSYELVCGGGTGHAEAVEIEFDPDKVSYHDLLKHFWQQHDPTTLNRQGPDIGRQYRSVIFYHSPEQKVLAEQSKQELEASGKLKDDIVTEIIPAQEFYEAEAYHQRYLAKQQKNNH